MTGIDRPTPESLAADEITPAGPGDPAWGQQWQQVPESWRSLRYRFETAPSDAVFFCATRAT